MGEYSSSRDIGVKAPPYSCQVPPWDCHSPFRLGQGTSPASLKFAWTTKLSWFPCLPLQYNSCLSQDLQANPSGWSSPSPCTGSLNPISWEKRHTDHKSGLSSTKCPCCSAVSIFCCFASNELHSPRAGWGLTSSSNLPPPPWSGTSILQIKIGPLLPTLIHEIHLQHNMLNQDNPLPPVS